MSETPGDVLLKKQSSTVRQVFSNIEQTVFTQEEVDKARKEIMDSDLSAEEKEYLEIFLHNKENLIMFDRYGTPAPSAS